MAGLWNSITDPVTHEGHLWGRRIVWLLLGAATLVFFFAPGAGFLSMRIFGFDYFVLRAFGVFCAITAIDVYFKGV
jgi:hypothetical protein